MESSGMMNQIDEQDDGGVVGALAHYAMGQGLTIARWSNISGISALRITSLMSDPLDVTLEKLSALAGSLGVAVSVALYEAKQEEQVH